MYWRFLITVSHGNSKKYKIASVLTYKNSLMWILHSDVLEFLYMQPVNGWLLITAIEIKIYHCLIFYLMVHFVSTRNTDAYLSIMICQFIKIFWLQNMEWYLTSLTEVAVISGVSITIDLKSPHHWGMQHRGKAAESNA